MAKFVNIPLTFTPQYQVDFYVLRDDVVNPEDVGDIVKSDGIRYPVHFPVGVTMAGGKFCRRCSFVCGMEIYITCSMN